MVIFLYIVQCLMFNGCRVVMPNGHFTLYCSMLDVQWVSDSQAEWPFFFICSMLMFNGCRVVGPNGHLFFIFVQCLMFSGCRVVTEEKLDVQFLMPSQSPLLLLC